MSAVPSGGSHDPLQLNYGKPFKRPTIFIGGSRDVASEIAAAYQAVDEIRRTRFPGLYPYHWKEEQYFDQGSDWQDNIGRPADPRVELAIFFFRGRLGLPLPKIRERLASPRFAPLREFISSIGLVVEQDDAAALPLTGTLFELLEAFRARAAGRDRPRILIYRLDSPDAEDVESKKQQLWLTDLFDHQWRSDPGWPDPIRPQGPIFEHVRDQVHRALFGEQYTEFDTVFPGVEAYASTAASAFFGRADEAHRIVENLRTAAASGERTFVLLNGPSGSGKSSLARAGLARPWGTTIAGGPGGVMAEYVVPAAEEELDGQTLQGFVAEIAAQLGCSGFVDAVSAWPADIPPNVAANECGAALKIALVQRPPMIVFDQAERILVHADPLTGDTPRDESGRFRVIRPNWAPILQFLDHFTRKGGGGSVVATIADDAQPGQRSFYDRLVLSSPFKSMEKEGGAVAKRAIIPLSDDAIGEIAKSSFGAVRFPIPDSSLTKFLTEEFGHCGRSPALFAALLRELAMIVKANMRAGEGRRSRALSLRDLPHLPRMSAIIDQLGDRALVAFRAAKRGADGTTADVDKVLTRVFRGLLRIERTFDNDEETGAPVVHIEYSLQAERLSGDALDLVNQLHAVHLAHRVGRDRHALLHEAVVTNWSSGVEWLDREYELAILRRKLSIEQSRGEGQKRGLSHSDTTQALALLAKWRQDDDAFSDADRVLIDDEGAELVASISPAERTDLFLNALNAGCEKTVKRCTSPPAGTKLRHWLDVNAQSRRGSSRPGLLAMAARMRSWSAYEWLFHQNADPTAADARGWTALHELARVRARAQIAAVFAGSARAQLRRRLIDAPGGPTHVSALHMVFAPACGGADDDDEAAKTVAVLLANGANARQRSNFGRTALHEAAQGGYVSAFSRLIRRDPSALLLTNQEGQTAVHMAAYYGNAGAVRALRQTSKAVSDLVPQLLRIADRHTPDAGGGRTALHSAARRGHTDVIRALVNLGSPLDTLDGDGATALIHAVKGRHSSCAQALLHLMQNAGVDAFQTDAGGLSPIHHAAEVGDRVTLAPLLTKQGARHINVQDSEGKTALVRALSVAFVDARRREGILSCARLLLKRGADPCVLDRDGRSAMSWAAGQNAPDIMNLIYAKAPQLALSPSLKGRTPMHEAAEYGGPEAIDRLIVWRAPLDTPGSDLNTPFHGAAFANANESLVHLIKCAGPNAGAMICARNAHGDTPLHSAADGTSVACAETLIAAGVEVNAENHHRRTPLARAARVGSFELAELFLDHGANPNALDEDGQAPLTESIKAGNLPLSLMLVDRMSLAALSARDHRHQSNVLHLICLRERLFDEDERIEITSAVISRAAKLCRADAGTMDGFINAPDSRGRSIRYLARGANLLRLDKLLAQNGGKMRALRAAIALEPIKVAAPHKSSGQVARMALELMTCAFYLAVASIVLLVLFRFAR